MLRQSQLRLLFLMTEIKNFGGNRQLASTDKIESARPVKLFKKFLNFLKAFLVIVSVRRTNG